MSSVMPGALGCSAGLVAGSVGLAGSVGRRASRRPAYRLVGVALCGMVGRFPAAMPVGASSRPSRSIGRLARLGQGIRSIACPPGPVSRSVGCWFGRPACRMFRLNGRSAVPPLAGRYIGWLAGEPHAKQFAREIGRVGRAAGRSVRPLFGSVKPGLCNIRM